jgi:phage gp36-like protein
MPRYCDTEDLGRFGANAEAFALLSVDLTGPPCDAASEIVDGFLKGRFTLPLTSWGQEIRRAAAIIAAWDILRVRGLKPGENPEDNALYLEYKQVLKWLGQVSAGDVTPSVTDSSPGAVPGLSTVSTIVESNEQRGFFTETPGKALPFQGRRRVSR